MSGTAGTEFADELIKAHQRGVKVQVILDGDTRGGVVAAQLASGLGTDRSAASWLHVCTGPMSGGTAACIGDKGQHNKFYLFSKTGDASNVVVQSSANLTDLNSSTYWNNAVVLPGNKRLYQAYDGYFEDLAAERKNLDYYRVVNTGAAGGSVRVHFFPKAGTADPDRRVPRQGLLQGRPHDRPGRDVGVGHLPPSRSPRSCATWPPRAARSRSSTASWTTRSSRSC